MPLCQVSAPRPASRPGSFIQGAEPDVLAGSNHFLVPTCVQEDLEAAPANRLRLLLRWSCEPPVRGPMDRCPGSVRSVGKPKEPPLPRSTICRLGELGEVPASWRSRHSPLPARPLERGRRRFPVGSRLRRVGCIRAQQLVIHEDGKWGPEITTRPRARWQRTASRLLLPCPADLTAPRSRLPANRANGEVGKPPSRSSWTSLEARHRGPSSGRRAGPCQGPRTACTFCHQVTKRGPPQAPNDVRSLAPPSASRAAGDARFRRSTRTTHRRTGAPRQVARASPEDRRVERSARSEDSAPARSRVQPGSDGESSFGAEPTERRTARGQAPSADGRCQ